MSGKLDQSLDQILSDRKTSTRGRGRGRGRRVANAARVTRAAPAGGIQKNTRTKNTAAAAPITNGAANAGTETKIIVSNLPTDVSEAQIKEYFGSTVGPVKRVFVVYGPNGVSRGQATVIFSKPGSANTAVTKCNGLAVDGRPMRIELVLDATTSSQRNTKALSERLSQPKSAAPKQATESKTTATRGGKAGRGGRGAAARGRGRRAKPKTADELDAEMADYFDPNAPAGTSNAENAPATNGTAAAGADDTGMDEIS